MQKNNKKRIIGLILFLLILLFICILCLFFTLQFSQDSVSLPNTNTVDKNDTESQLVVTTTPKTIKEVIEKHESEYIEEIENEIHVKFVNDLYDEKGNSNQEYFENMIKDLTELEILEEKDFYLIDEEKQIEIDVIYDRQSKKHIILYNHIENFYDKTNGDEYAYSEKVAIAKAAPLTPVKKELYNLVTGEMFFRSISSYIGTGEELGNGYTSYQDGTIKMKLIDYRVSNIIFTKECKNEIFSGIKVGTSLEEIYEKYKDYTDGSPEDGYLFYRTKDVYAFFYDDEISVYSYNYSKNKFFEQYLEEYLTDGNLDKFIQNVTANWVNYETYEYDPEIQYAHITYPSRGVEIKITDNNPKGITLYTNYYLTDETKKFIKDGKISLNYKDDLLEITEKERRKNF